MYSAESNQVAPNLFVTLENKFATIKPYTLSTMSGQWLISVIGLSIGKLNNQNNITSQVAFISENTDPHGTISNMAFILSRHNSMFALTPDGSIYRNPYIYRVGTMLNAAHHNVSSIQRTEFVGNYLHKSPQLIQFDIFETQVQTELVQTFNLFADRRVREISSNQEIMQNWTKVLLSFLKTNL